MSFAFFDSLFPTVPGGQDLGYVVIATFPSGRFNPGAAPDQHHWFAWPSQKEEIFAFCLANYDSDLYTVPALFKTRSHRRADNIAHQWVVYADADSLDLKHLKVEPSMIVETSDNRHHTYWATTTDDPERLCEVGRAIAHTHAHQGCDKGGWDAGQLLRVPGTSNTKYRFEGKDPFEVRVKRFGKPVPIEVLEETYPPVAPLIPDGIDGPMPPMSEWKHGTETAADAIRVLHECPHIEELATKPITAKTDRSTMMWRLLSEMSRSQVKPVTALSIAWTSPCNKYRLDGRTPEELWHELNRAYADPQNKPVTSSFDALVNIRPTSSPIAKAIEALPNNPERRAKELISGLSLLTDDERAQMPTDTFVDHYVRWAATQTDAPHCYHRAGAASVLTTIFGQYGMCPTQFMTNLTLWFMLLGPTTRARKTTAMNLWVDLVASMQHSGHSYLLGSDVTTEALAKILPRRDGKTSVFFRDEVHGLFTEQEKKRYLAGLREYMTDLYTGNVPISLRAGNIADDEEEAEDTSLTPKGRTKTNFVMFLCGTIEQVTNSLTVADYQSGHLARFLAVEADPPLLTKERVRVEQSRGRRHGVDIQRQNLLIDLDRAREFWHERTDGGRTKEMVYFADDAWDRYQEANWAIIDTAQQDAALTELMSPTATRMGISTMKMSILLAMGEGKDEVSMRHVLKAIELTEEWYTTTAVIAGKVVSSTWHARQEEMLVSIRAKRDGKTEQEIYRDFRTRYTVNDIEHDLTMLTRAGAIVKLNEIGGRTKYVATSRS